ncbi:hypothetical protein ABPG72_005903 [Tetrahymena utriculariae]
MVCAKGKGRKEKGITTRKHLNSEQKYWIKGYLTNSRVNEAFQYTLKDLQDSFKNEFQRNVSRHAIDRIKKEILTKTQANSQSNLRKPKQQKKKPGQKRMTSKKEDKIIIQSIENNNRKSWEQISKLLIEEYQIDVSNYQKHHQFLSNQM